MSVQARSIPPEVAETINTWREQGDRRWVTMAVALKRRGYTLAAIGDAAGVSRQRIHQLVRAETYKLHRAHAPLITEGMPLPPRVKGHPPMPPESRTMALEDEVLLRGLWAMTSKRRGSHGPGHPLQQAHNDLVVLVTRLVEEGWTFVQIAEAVDIHPSSFQNRMLRAGVRAREIRSDGVA